MSERDQAKFDIGPVGSPESRTGPGIVSARAERTQSRAIAGQLAVDRVSDAKACFLNTFASA